MRYHPNSNKRYRLKLKQLCRKLCNKFHSDLLLKNENKPLVTPASNPYKFTIIRSDGRKISIEPIPKDSSILGEKSNIVAYAGDLPIEALAHLYSK